MPISSIAAAPAEPLEFACDLTCHREEEPGSLDSDTESDVEVVLPTVDPLVAAYRRLAAAELSAALANVAMLRRPPAGRARQPEGRPQRARQGRLPRRHSPLATPSWGARGSRRAADRAPLPDPGARCFDPPGRGERPGCGPPLPLAGPDDFLSSLGGSPASSQTGGTCWLGAAPAALELAELRGHSTSPDSRLLLSPLRPPSRFSGAHGLSLHGAGAQVLEGAGWCDAALASDDSEPREDLWAGGGMRLAWPGAPDGEVEAGWADIGQLENPLKVGGIDLLWPGDDEPMSSADFLALESAAW